MDRIGADQGGALDLKTTFKLKQLETNEKKPGLMRKSSLRPSQQNVTELKPAAQAKQTKKGVSMNLRKDAGSKKGTSTSNT